MGVNTTLLQTNLRLLRELFIDTVDVLDELNTKTWSDVPQGLFEEMASQTTLLAAASLSEINGTNSGASAARFNQLNVAFTRLQNIEPFIRNVDLALSNKDWSGAKVLIATWTAQKLEVINILNDFITNGIDSSTAGARYSDVVLAVRDIEGIINRITEVFNARINKRYNEVSRIILIMRNEIADLETRINNIRTV